MMWWWNYTPRLDKSLENSRRAFAVGYLSEVRGVEEKEISNNDIDEFLWNLELCSCVQILRVAQIMSFFGPNLFTPLYFNLADRVYHVTQLENRRSKPGKPTALKQRIIKYGAYHVLYYGWYYPLQML